jgi:hypothetical protein
MRFHKLAPNLSPIDSKGAFGTHLLPLLSPQNAQGFTYAARFLPRLRPLSHLSRPILHSCAAKLLFQRCNSAPESELRIFE